MEWHVAHITGPLDTDRFPQRYAVGTDRFPPRKKRRNAMPGDSHVTAPTRFAEAGGVRYAYRQFGSEAGTPLVFIQHFRDGMDNCDPLVTDGLAAGRPVILFDNAGAARSSGQTLRHHRGPGRRHCRLPRQPRPAASRRAGPLHRRHHRPGPDPAPSRWCAAARPGRHGTARRRDRGQAPGRHGGGPARGASAGGLPVPVFRAVRDQPAGREGVLGAAPPAHADVGPPTSAQTAQAQFPPPGGGKIACADVAHFIATALASASYIRESPALAY